jgi:CPA1 family monovalent cation:H+ antiporter
MLGFETILLLVIVLMVLAPLAKRLDIPLPVVQVAAGLLLSAIPLLKDLEFDPELVFLIFVPPLLYWSCITSSMRDLRRMRKEIGVLAVGAVVATIAAVALASHYGPPHLAWGPAVVLGAIISPPDAAVTIAIARQLGLPRRLVSLLEGETLFNDVAAFTAYRMAIAATVTGTFVARDILPTLLYAALGAFAIGWLVAQGVWWLRRHIHDPIVANTLSLMTAYAAYLPAEWLHTSGVVAVVTTGLMLGRSAPRLVDAATRVQAQQVWPLVMFILNGLIFLLIGLQIGRLGIAVAVGHDGDLLVAAASICLVVIAVRVAFVFCASYLRSLMHGRAAAGSQRHWSEILFVAWTGIRGGDTLVTALAIPLTISNGAPFPGRHAILVIAFAVILVTLVAQGATLRPLMRKATMAEDLSEIEEDRLARRELSLAGVARLSEIAAERHLPDDLLQQIKIHHHMRRHVRSGSEHQPENIGSSILANQLLTINRQVLKAEREAVLTLRDKGLIGDDILRTIQRELDLEELVMMRKAEEV